MAAILDKKKSLFSREFFWHNHLLSFISIKNHIQLEKSILQVVTELDFWFQIYFFFKEIFFYFSDIFYVKIMCDN